MNLLKVIKEEVESYHGEHQAADKTSGYPLSDCSDAYGEDIYTSNAMRYFGSGNDYDRQSIAIIQALRNKPNRAVKIYRAVPDINYDLNKQINYFYGLLLYVDKFGFPPMKDIEAREIHSGLGYDKTKTIEYLNSKLRELSTQKESGIKINNGDWVTISLEYAKWHGRNNLKRFKVITKTVPARSLFTTGDDVNEWGYDAN